MWWRGLDSIPDVQTSFCWCGGCGGCGGAARGFVRCGRRVEGVGDVIPPPLQRSSEDELFQTDPDVFEALQLTDIAFGSRKPGWLDGWLSWLAGLSGLRFLSSESRRNPQIFVMMPRRAYRNDNNLSPQKSQVTERESGARKGRGAYEDVQTEPDRQLDGRTGARLLRGRRRRRRRGRTV